MKTLRERLAWAMDNAPTKLSQSDLARVAGVSRTSVSDWVSGKSVSMRGPNLLQIAGALNVNPQWLASGAGSARARATQNTAIGPEIRGKVPLISWVAAGAFNDAVDNFHPGEADEWVETTVPINQHTYALRVSGPSMTNPTGQEPTFPDGCKIVIEPNLIDQPQNMVGLFVIVRRNNEDTATFKQLIRDGSRFLLHPLNPQFENIELQVGDEFCGVVREKPVRYV